MTRAASGLGVDPTARRKVAGRESRERRLIEEWLPIAALSEECVRERRSMTALPPTYYLHVWWARRPLVASRAAILGSLLPADADRKDFMHTLGIHGDPVAAKLRMVEAAKNIDPATGEREDLGANPYGYERAFKYRPTEADRARIRRFSGSPATVLDSTAGGGSIPFEAVRLGCNTICNDLNPVAWLVLKATVELPARFGPALLERYTQLADAFKAKASARFTGIFPPEPPRVTVDGYLWARTITCPYCGGIVPLSPNWRLNNKGIGCRMTPAEAAQYRESAGADGHDRAARRMRFEIVQSLAEQPPGTVKGGDGLCPFPDCGRVIDSKEIQAQAKAGRMGEQLYAVVYTERKIVGYAKNGKPKLKKTRGFRAPRPEDEVGEVVDRALAAKMPEWQARNIVPDEEYPANSNDDRPRRYGMPLWRDMFSPRQLYGHCTAVEVFHELVDECGGPGHVGDLDAAALTYIAIAIDKLLNYNARSVRWHAKREVVAGVFDRHDFAFLWSYAEMAPTVTGLGFDWTIKQTGKALGELIELSHRDEGGNAHDGLFSTSTRHAGGAPVPYPAGMPGTPPAGSRCHSMTLTRGSGDDLPHIADGSVDAVVLDPPYYDNVMYAELADFFYVWLKRTAGLLYPEHFQDYLTDKDREAVANPAKFKDFSKVRGSGGSKNRASRDYRERMQAIFAEARRVLKPDGIMTLMFTHKATGAWDALAKGLVEAGFEITASWPVHTEAEGSLHIKEKNAAKSTIFLVCRPRGEREHSPLFDGPEPPQIYWEDVEPKVLGVVREKVVEFQASGISGVDLYLSCFGPALQVFSEHWPMTRGQPKQKPLPAKGAQLKLLEDEEFDPYEVRPEDALMAARAAVKEWRLEQIASLAKERRSHIDAVTEWFVLAWDAFKSPQFPADEALNLARVVGLNFDEQLRGKILEVKSGQVILWDSATRAKKGAIGSAKSACMLDPLHHAARAAREQNLNVAKDIVERAGLLESMDFRIALQAVLEVLPTPRAVSSNAPGPLAGAAKDAEVLEKLRRLSFAEHVPQSKQWTLFNMSAGD